MLYQEIMIMTSYLLLRNNKESGPYSLNDLLGLGLKPYDLVWVNGKSAAWRYPSEVEELKAYAPGVEEQPFDRFYKKPVEEEHFALTKSSNTAYQPRPVEEPVKTFVPKKSVFVTMPGNAQASKKQETIQPAAVATVPVSVPAASHQTPVPPPVSNNEVASEQTISIVENPATAKVKYSQPLDEIKEMYVKTLHERKEKIARKSVMKVYARRAAVIAGLVGLGVLAGFIIKPGGSKPAANNPVAAIVSAPAEIDESAGTTPVSPPAGENMQPEQQAAEDTKPAEDVPLPGSVSQKLNGQTITMVPVNNPRAKQESFERESGTDVVTEEKYSYNPPAKNAVTGERSRATRSNDDANTGSVTQSREPKAVMKAPAGNGNTNPWEGRISVSANDYKRVAFGGIRNLELTVVNHTRSSLDQVIVELQYIKPSEQPLKTENIRFKNIGAEEAMTIRIPDTNRGIRVEYRILNVQGINEVAGN